jgi:hypothetical protein
MHAAMPADLCAGAQIPLNRPTVALTNKGANLLALLACRDRLPHGDQFAAVLDRRIANLLEGVRP